MNKKELKLLFVSEKSYPTITKIDDLVLSTLEDFDWFSSDKKSNFLVKYENNLRQSIDLYNYTISKAKNKLVEELKKISEEKKLSEELNKLLIYASDFILKSNNFCNYENPLGLYKYDNASGDISYDSSSGYDGEEGRMDCWKLEENSRTSVCEVSLADIFNINTWSIKECENVYTDMVLMGQIFCDIGFDVYYFSISPWRKGYDFSCYLFEPHNSNKILNLIADDNVGNYFRIYIDKNY